MPLAPAGVNFHGLASGAWAQTIPLPERTNEILYYRAVADGGYLDDGDQVVYVDFGTGCSEANRANYAVDGAGEGNDHGGFVNLDVNGALSTTVNLLKSDTHYQACYYKPAGGSTSRLRRELSIVLDAWSPVEGFLSVTRDGATVDEMPPFAPPPPPFQYFVMDFCGTANNAMANPLCMDPAESQIPALPIAGLALGGGGYNPTGGQDIMVRCCWDDASQPDGYNCEAHSDGNDNDNNECYSGMIGFGGRVAKTWAEARTICENDGRRLCTVAELSDIPCCGSGCSYDAHALWSQDVCNFSPESPPSPLPPPPSPPAHPPAPPLCESNTCHICDTRDIAEAACASNDFTACLLTPTIAAATLRGGIALDLSPPPPSPPPPTPPPPTPPPPMCPGVAFAPTMNTPCTDLPNGRELMKAECRDFAEALEASTNGGDGVNNFPCTASYCEGGLHVFSNTIYPVGCQVPNTDGTPGDFLYNGQYEIWFGEHATGGTSGSRTKVCHYDNAVECAPTVTPVECASPSVPHGSVEWALGAVGEDCDAACGDWGLTCYAAIDESSYSSASCMNALGAGLGEPCSQALAGSSSQNPGVHKSGMNSNNCWWNAASGFSCTATSATYKRFCPCLPTGRRRLAEDYEDERPDSSLFDDPKLVAFKRMLTTMDGHSPGSCTVTTHTDVIHDTIGLDPNLGFATCEDAGHVTMTADECEDATQSGDALELKEANGGFALPATGAFAGALTFSSPVPSSGFGVALGCMQNTPALVDVLTGTSQSGRLTHFSGTPASAFTTCAGNSADTRWCVCKRATPKF